jgi:hypothetical protein
MEGSHMELDRQRIAAVSLLETMGYRYQSGKWEPSASAPLPLSWEADAMHGALMRRADALAGCTENSEEEIELKAIVDALEAYEAKRWPLGRDPNVQHGKG